MFRTNIVDLGEDTTKLVTVSAPTSSLTCRELLAKLVEAGHLEEGCTFTVARVASGLIVSDEEVVHHTAQIAIYPQGGEDAQVLTTKISVNGSEFTFFVDATVGTVVGALLSKLPDLQEQALWWQGIDIADGAFTNVRVGQLLTASRQWSPRLVTALIATLTEERSSDEATDQTDIKQSSEEVDFFSPEPELTEDADFFSPEAEGENAPAQTSGGDFFACDAIDTNDKINFYSNEKGTSTDAGDIMSVKITFETFDVLNTTTVRLHFSNVEPLEFRVRTAAMTETAIAQPLITLLSIMTALPPSLIAPSLQAGTEKAPGCITIVKPSADGGPFDVYIEPLREYQVTLMDRYEFASDGSAIQTIDHIPIYLFAPMPSQLVPVSSQDLRIATHVANVATSPSIKSFFNTNADAEEPNEETYFHALRCAVASIVAGQSLLHSPADAFGKNSI